MTTPQTTGTRSSRPHRLRPWLIMGGVVLAAVMWIGGYWLTTPTRGIDPSPQPGPVEPGVVTSPPWFRDMTAGSGLHFAYRNGEEADQFTMLETLGGGGALFDYDGDGLLDIFGVGGGYFDGPDKEQIKGHPCKLYKNLGNWKFQDVTKDVGLDGVSWWYTHGAAVADYDRDGWPDLLVTGWGRLALFRNESNGKGGRLFVDVSEKVGLRDDSWSNSAAWADLDGDGFPDLYVCHYTDWSFANNPPCKNFNGNQQDTCHPSNFKPLVHALFHNANGKSFRNVSAEHGFKPDSKGLGVLMADLNDDRQPDIFVANDGNNNFLFFNRSPSERSPEAKSKLHLEERGLRAGVATNPNGHAEGNMGVEAADYDGSGRPSLFVTHFEGEPHGLYQNLGRDVFNYQSNAAGLVEIGVSLVGWGTGFIDLDNDGWEDLFIANGHPWRHPAPGTPKQPPVLLHNVDQRGNRRFRDIGTQGGTFFETRMSGRGVAVGDLDNDGWPDVVISCVNSPLALLRNEAAMGMKQAHRWLGVKLVGSEDRDVVGSTVILEGTTRTLTRFAKGGGSFLSSGDHRILFGLGGSEQVRRVTVKWSWGNEQHFDNLEPGSYWELREGEAAAIRVRAVKPANASMHISVHLKR